MSKERLNHEVSKLLAQIDLCLDLSKYLLENKDDPKAVQEFLDREIKYLKQKVEKLGGDNL